MSRRQYTWGRDLSGSLEGAGGIGGLLAVHDVNLSEDYVYASDAMGNIGQLVALASGYGGATAEEWHADRLVARYEYDPYGNVVGPDSDGDGFADAFDDDTPYAAANVYRFSTKPQDAETGLSYFGYRYYNARLGRWINRDPIDEQSDLGNVGAAHALAIAANPSAAGAPYRSLRNSVSNVIDPDGRFPVSYSLFGPLPMVDVATYHCIDVFAGLTHCDVECTSLTTGTMSGGGTGKGSGVVSGIGNMGPIDFPGWTQPAPFGAKPEQLTYVAFYPLGTCACLQRKGADYNALSIDRYYHSDIPGPYSTSNSVLQLLHTCCGIYDLPKRLPYARGIENGPLHTGTCERYHHREIPGMALPIRESVGCRWFREVDCSML